MPVNSILIKEKFITSRKYLIKLEQLLENTPEEIEQDIELQLQAERIFEILAQVILDVCTHIVAHSEESPPASYADCIKKLANLGVIDEQQASKFGSMIKCGT